MTIAHEGKAQCVVVVAKDAIPDEQQAADILTNFLHQVTGARFEKVETAQAGQQRLLVGADAARLADSKFTIKELGTDGIVVRTVGSDLILAGGRPRGTVYAVYSFLEDVVGCRWWSPTVSAIPRKPNLEIAGLDMTYVPPFDEYRLSEWPGVVRTHATATSWQARNRCSYGPSFVYGLYYHSFHQLIPPEKHFKDHPEWFSEIKGKRSDAGNSQLCLTNEEMIKELVRNLKVFLRNDPTATIASVSQNDSGWQGNCECETCRAVEKEEGSPSGALIRFVNSVAADIEKEFPRVSIHTYAYEYTTKPPLKVKARDNVIVQLCPIFCNFAQPLDTGWNAGFGKDLEGWSKTCRHLHIFNYAVNFWNYQHPHPNFRVLAPNLKLFAKSGVKGVQELGALGDYQPLGAAEMAELRAWLLAKLLWDPQRDDRELMKEFLNGFYGAAGPHLLAYLDAIHDEVDRTKFYLSYKYGYGLSSYDYTYGPVPTNRMLGFASLAKSWQHLGEAEKAVKDDQTLANRVQLARIPITGLLIAQWKELRLEAGMLKQEWPFPSSALDLYKKLESTWKDNGVTNMITRYGDSLQGFRSAAAAAAQEEEKMRLTTPGEKF